jgi:hypothetical protein
VGHEHGQPVADPLDARAASIEDDPGDVDEVVPRNPPCPPGSTTGLRVLGITPGDRSDPKAACAGTTANDVRRPWVDRTSRTTGTIGP